MRIHIAVLRLSLLNLRERCRYAIVTLDGSVMLVDDDPDKKPVDSIMWNLQVNQNPSLVYLLPAILLFISREALIIRPFFQVDHQLMCLSKLDITGMLMHLPNTNL
jgi:hypothetical protein